MKLLYQRGDEVFLVQMAGAFYVINTENEVISQKKYKEQFIKLGYVEEADQSYYDEVKVIFDRLIHKVKEMDTVYS